MRNDDENSPENQGITFAVKHRYNPLKVFKMCMWNLMFIVFFVFATLNFINQSNKTGNEKNAFKNK